MNDENIDIDQPLTLISCHQHALINDQVSIKGASRVTNETEMNIRPRKVKHPYCLCRFIIVCFSFCSVHFAFDFITAAFLVHQAHVLCDCLYACRIKEKHSQIGMW